MAIDVFAEKPIHVKEAIKLVPSRLPGRRLALATLYRWAQSGVKGKDGSRVRLEIVKIGGSTFTSQEALRRFFDRLSENPSVEVPLSLTARQRRKRSEAARETLSSTLAITWPA